jgi:hypothetical protein
MTIVLLAVAWLGVTASVATPVAVGQEKPAASDALDPRLKPLIGTWEGRVRFQSSKDEEGRVLVIREKDGQLEGRYGIVGKNPSRVALSVEAHEANPGVTFTTSNGHRVILQLAREDWLTGKYILGSVNRGAGSPERQIDFQRKK